MGLPPHNTVHRLFAAQAALTPDAIAITQAAHEPGRSTSLTYAQLDSWANGIARALGAAGVRPGDRVALLLGRSPEFIAALIGVLKAGASYVPLDPAYPRDRLAWMLQDSNPAACVVRGNDVLSDVAGRIPQVAVGLHAEAHALVHPSLPDVPDDGERAAYVMYTSGSTGTPKGVVVPHRAILRLVTGQEYVQFDATRVFFQLAPVAFDASTFEIWGALLHGGRCVLAPDDAAPDLTRLGSVIAEHGVTTMWLTASLFNTIVDHAPHALATVSELVTGGEALSVAHVRRAQDLLPRIQLVNGYGPTECTTFACCYRIPRPIPEGWLSIPIGYALRQTTIHVEDEQGRPVSLGGEGDLYLGGDGLALEYLNSPDLTAARFPVRPGLGRVYQTGDRVRSRQDGALDFLGRNDDQLKVRGYRIEPGEVEAALREVAGVTDAIVTVREDQPGDRRLVAYYTVRDCVIGPSPRALRGYLGGRLPEHMVPSAYVQLDRFLLTPNGKVDRRALPRPSRARPELDRVATAPATALEQWLAALWRDVLQLDDVGVHDRFFELGGTSLAAMRFLGHLNAEARSPLPALLLFRAPTIAELADVMAREFAHALPAFLASQETRAPLSAVADRRTQRADELRQRRQRRRRAT